MAPSLTLGPPCPSSLPSLVPCGRRGCRAFQPGPEPRPSGCGWVPYGRQGGPQRAPVPCPLRCSPGRVGLRAVSQTWLTRWQAPRAPTPGPRIAALGRCRDFGRQRRPRPGFSAETAAEAPQPSLIPAPFWPK